MLVNYIIVIVWWISDDFQRPMAKISRFEHEIGGSTNTPIKNSIPIK